MTFSNSDAKVASTRPGTHLKRRGSKFRFGWWSGHLHSSHMDPIGEKTVPHMVNSSLRVTQARPWTQAGTQGPSRALGPLGVLWGAVGALWGPFHFPPPPVEPYINKKLIFSNPPRLCTKSSLREHATAETGETGETGEAEVVSRTVAQSPPSTHAGGQDDGSYTNSLKLVLRFLGGR